MLPKTVTTPNGKYGLSKEERVNLVRSLIWLLWYILSSKHRYSRRFVRQLSFVRNSCFSLCCFRSSKKLSDIKRYFDIKRFHGKTIIVYKPESKNLDNKTIHWGFRWKLCWLSQSSTTIDLIKQKHIKKSRQALLMPQICQHIKNLWL